MEQPLKDELSSIWASQEAAKGPPVTSATDGRQDLKRKKPMVQPSILVAANAPPMTSELVVEADFKLLRWVVTSGIPFAAVDNPYFLDWVRTFRPVYVPAGRLGTP